MAVNISFIGGAGWQFFDNNGDPLSGGKIYTYAAGTTVPLASYTSRTGLTPNSNPIILDSAGRCPAEIWTTEGLLYKFAVYTSNNVQIRIWDDVGGSVVASDLAQDLASTIDNAKGDALVGFRQSDGSGFLSGAVARTVNSKLQDVLTLEDFGAVGNNVTNDRNAFLAAKTAAAASGLPITLHRQYYVGLDQLSMDDVPFVGYEGAQIRGNWDRKASYTLDGRLNIELADAGGAYVSMQETTKYRRALGDKEVFFDSENLDRTVQVAVDCTNLAVEQVAWPAGDTWFPIVGEPATNRTLTLTLSPTVFRAGFLVARGGDEISCKPASGAYDRAAIIRTSAGYYIFYTPGQTAAGQLWFKPIGGAAVKLNDIDWLGRNVQQNWYPGNADWTIRLYDLRTFSIMLNGVELFGTRIQVNGIINKIGFGGRSDPTVAFSFNDWALTRGTQIEGSTGFIRVTTAGDSRTAPYWGDWPTYCQELLEHSIGASVLSMNNIAVDGWTSATTLATVVADGLSGCTDFVLAVGTNDAQNNVAINSTIANVEATIDFAQSQNCRVVVVLPQDYYPKADTGLGVTVFNEAFLPIYRQAIHRVAAAKGCRVVDLSQILKPTLYFEANPPLAAPWFAGQTKSGLRDNIHNGPLQYRKIGWAVARAILSWAPEKQRGFNLTPINADMFANGWTSNVTDPAGVKVDPAGNVFLSGVVNVGTAVNGTVLLNLPLTITPVKTRFFMVLGNLGTVGRFGVTNAGEIKVYGFAAASDTTVYLDQMFWDAP